MTRRSRRAARAAALSAAPVAISAAWSSTVVAWSATTVSTVWILALAWSDRVARQLPDLLVALAVLPTVMAAGVSALQGSRSALPEIYFGALIWALPLAVGHMARPADLGFGDVKAAAATGATLGLTQPPVSIGLGLVAALAGAAIVGATRRRSHVGLGPFFAGAAIGTVAAGPLAEVLA